jgi:hypothetical protein
MELNPEMPIELKEGNGSNILIVRASGTLVKADYQPFVAEFERFLGQHGKLRVLFDITELHGWEPGAAWEDIKFDLKHFADIERLAMVGEKKWQHAMAILWKPFTEAKTRYFDHTEVAEAKEWLRET